MIALKDLSIVVPGLLSYLQHGTGPMAQPCTGHHNGFQELAVDRVVRAICLTTQKVPIMKILAILTLAVAAAVPAQAGTNIDVTIGINAPGQYGRIDVNNYPQVQLVTPRAIVYAPSPVAIHQQPIYLYVPQGHQTNWGRYCGRYGACGQPVYFVQENWVRDEYRHQHDKNKGKKKDKRHDRKHHGKD